MKLVTTKAKNIFDEKFFDKFSYANLKICMFKRQKVRQIGTAQLSFSLEQICSIYIHVCAKWGKVGLVVLEKNTIQ